MFRWGAPMRVLHVITSLDSGGAESVLARLCLADKQNIHSVISLMDEGIYGGSLRNAGVQVYVAGMPRGKLTLRGLWRLWRFIRRARPDVLQTWMYHGDFLGGVLGRLAGVRNIVWGIRNTDLSPGKSSRMTILVARACARLSRVIPAKIAVCAEKAAEVHACLGYARDKMVMIPNGYDLARFKPDPDAREAVRQEFSVGEEDYLVGMVARYDPFKDHTNLISALQLIVERGINFHCLLVGEGIGPANEALVSVIAQAGLSTRISLLGRRSDIPDLMNGLDVHVLASSSEAFPNVVAEAMACGTPGISTDVGDAALIVGNTGWVVPPGDPEAMADALVTARKERALPEQWQTRQKLARQRIETEFSMDRMVSRFQAVWQEVSAGTGVPRG